MRTEDLKVYQQQISENSLDMRLIKTRVYPTKVMKKAHSKLLPQFFKFDIFNLKAKHYLDTKLHIRLKVYWLNWKCLSIFPRLTGAHWNKRKWLQCFDSDLIAGNLTHKFDPFQLKAYSALLMDFHFVEGIACWLSIKCWRG